MSKSAEIDNFSSSKDEVYSADVGEPQVVLASQTDSNRHSVQRGLKVRHIQLIAISGAIGAGVFISIGNPLVAAGPLALLIGIAIWSSVILAFSFCLIEMTTLLPLPGGYIYYSGRFLDPSIRFAQGWSTVLLGVAFVCFELTAMNVVVSFWAPDLHPAIVISAGLVVLMAINGLNVRYYGEVEFWISILKVLLMIGLFMFTFITMVGGNPLGDRYGFRYWRDPGLFAKPDVVGRLKGIWASVMWGAFAIAGPEFISMVAGETQSPRRVLPKAFNSTIYRVVFFYMGSALCVAINTPYNDPALLGAIAAGAPGAARSPYIINMNRLQVSVLPSLTNAVILTSILSTACSFTYSSSRALYSLGMEGQAPKFFTKTNRWGTPYVGVFTIGLFSCLSYLAVSSGTVKVLDWFVNLTTACTLLTWNTTGYTYLRFRAGLKAQRLENLLPVRGYLQPYAGYYATFMASFTLIFSGYTLFAPGAFSVPDTIFAYGAVFVYIFNFSFWKIKGVLRGEQRWFGIPAMEMDFTSDLDEIERITLEDQVAIEERKGKPETALQKVDRWLF